VSSIVLLPTIPAPPPPGAPITLAHLEREVAARLGPFWAFAATGGATESVAVATLRSTAELGGYEGLYLLRRDAIRTNDRIRTVERFDGPSGALQVDFPYEDAPVAGEPIELHHLHPDLQLFVDVQAALRRCYLLDALAVLPPPDAFTGLTGRATIYAVNGNSGGDGWVLLNGNGANTANGANGAPRPPSLHAQSPVLSQMAGVTDRSLPGEAAAVVDLTAQAFWLTDTRQILAVTDGGRLVPPCGRYGDPNADGWTVFSARGRVYLGLPRGVPLDGLTVRAYRDAFGLVNGLDTPGGPQADDDELAAPIEYAAAFAHVEAWRRHRDRLEASAAEGRFASQAEASAEATRVASIYADFLFVPALERGDRVQSPWGTQPKQSRLGLGGGGALAGAVANQNDPYR
jgi:hypothetical protein